jgi:hypothetical protein
VCIFAFGGIHCRHLSFILAHLQKGDRSTGNKATHTLVFPPEGQSSGECQLLCKTGCAAVPLLKGQELSPGCGSSWGAAAAETSNQQRKTVDRKKEDRSQQSQSRSGMLPAALCRAVMVVAAHAAVAAVTACCQRPRKLTHGFLQCQGDRFVTTAAASSGSGQPRSGSSVAALPLLHTCCSPTQQCPLPARPWLGLHASCCCCPSLAVLPDASLSGCIIAAAPPACQSARLPQAAFHSMSISQ